MDEVNCLVMVADIAESLPSSGISILGSHMPALALFLYI